jgi:hypothetical protein
MKLSATAKEAVANRQAEISHEAGAQPRAGARRSRARENGGPEQPDIVQRAANLRPRHSRVRLVVLLGRVPPTEHFGRLEHAAAEKRLERLNQPASRLGVEIVHGRGPGPRLRGRPVRCLVLFEIQDGAIDLSEPAECREPSHVGDARWRRPGDRTVRGTEIDADRVRGHWQRWQAIRSLPKASCPSDKIASLSRQITRVAAPRNPGASSSARGGQPNAPAASPIDVDRSAALGVARDASASACSARRCVEVEAAYYGTPPAWIGRRVDVQWNDLFVRLLDPKTGQLLREHVRAPRGWHRIADMPIGRDGRRPRR